MIHCLTGDVIYIDQTASAAVIDCAGVGYRVSVSTNTLPKLRERYGEKIRVYTHMQVREDAVELFGFYDTEELDAFRLLITVSGVGPRGALAILSVLTPKGLCDAVMSDDRRAISRAQGIGQKTAARVVLELKDSLSKVFPTALREASAKGSVRNASPAASSKMSDARDALTVLGFSAADAARALGSVDTDGDVEEIIKNALGYLMK